MNTPQSAAESALEAGVTAYNYRLLPTRTCITMDPSIEALVGYSSAEFLGEPALLFDIVHPQDRSHWLRLLAGDVEKARIRMVARDGSVVWCEHTVARISEGGQLVAVRGTLRRIQPPPGRCGRYRPLCVRLVEGSSAGVDDLWEV